MFGLHEVYKQIDPSEKQVDDYVKPIVDSAIPILESFVWIHDVKEGSPAEQDGL